MFEPETAWPADTAAFALDAHPTCFACRKRALGGLGLCFRQDPDGATTAEFDCDPRYRSYPDRLHGGIVALLLDTAMTQCLFSRGFRGVTARLAVRYRAAVEPGVTPRIRATVLRSARRRHRLRAEVVQRGTVRATAEALFVSLPPRSDQTQGAGRPPERNPT